MIQLVTASVQARS